MNHPLTYDPWQDIGDGHHIQIVRDADGVMRSVVDEHKASDGHPCSGAARVNPQDGDEGSHWEIVSEDPLTLSPSLLCRQCGDHGWIRDGKWARA